MSAKLHARGQSWDADPRFSGVSAVSRASHLQGGLGTTQQRLLFSSAWHTKDTDKSPAQFSKAAVVYCMLLLMRVSHACSEAWTGVAQSSVFSTQTPCAAATGKQSTVSARKPFASTSVHFDSIARLGRFAEEPWPVAGPWPTEVQQFDYEQRLQLLGFGLNTTSAM